MSTGPIGRTGMRIVRIAVLSLLIAVNVSVVSAERSPVLLEPAPDFVLASSTGHNLRLSEYRGEIVMLNFWSSACGPCRDQLDWFGRIGAAGRYSEVAILSVNVDAKKHSADHALTGRDTKFPVLFDTHKTVSRIYDPHRLPMIVLIDPHGNIRFIHEGHRAGDEELFERELDSILAE